MSDPDSNWKTEVGSSLGRIASRSVVVSINALRRVGGFCVVVLILACDYAESMQTIVERDSAGVAIREYPADPHLEDLARLRGAEIVSIGAVEGGEAETFNRIGDLASDSRGRIHVLDAGDQIVDVYDPDGEWILRYGGRGAGPAEFQGASLLIPLSDSMGVYDYRNQKVALFGTDGSLLVTRRWELPIFEFGFPSDLAGIPGGLAAEFKTGCSMPPPEDRRATWKLLTLGPDGAVRDTVMRRFRGDLIPLYGEQFCSVIPALAGSGYEIAVRPDGTVAFASEQEYEVHLFRLSAYGDEQYEGSFPPSDRIVRRALDRVAITGIQIEEYRDRYLVTPEGDPIDRDLMEAIEQALDSTDLPEGYPHIETLLWDQTGRLWVGRSVAGDISDRTWDIYNDEGNLEAEVVLPANLENVLVTGDMVWGTTRDDLGVMYVKGFRIEETVLAGS
ncbi:MAG: hypothetical protein OEZ65_16970 [Gemmatimonadota bacterium]|nr:hypothetical protein [Gemmatimonadota bacterium]